MESTELEQHLRTLFNQPLKWYDQDLENLKFGYSNKDITLQMIKVAFERGEITLQQYVKIIYNYE
jgi:hypothetical protein